MCMYLSCVCLSYPFVVFVIRIYTNLCYIWHCLPFMVTRKCWLSSKRRSQTSVGGVGKGLDGGVSSEVFRKQEVGCPGSECSYPVPS